MIRCHPQEAKTLSGNLGPAVHSALRAPRSREAYMFAKPPSKKPLFLVPDKHVASTFACLFLTNKECNHVRQHGIGRSVGYAWEKRIGTPPLYLSTFEHAPIRHCGDLAWVSCMSQDGWGFECQKMHFVNCT